MTDTSMTPARGRLNTAIWAAQIILALMFGMAGVLKTFMPPADLAALGLNYASELPLPLLRFIGISELAGAFGIVLPAATRILPWLTPVTAAAFITVQVLAIGFHAIRGELAMALPLNLFMLGLSLFVLLGRWRKAPIAARG